MTVYADSMFLLNFIIDYLLLLATGKICALRLTRGRMLLGAAWGGVYAVLTLVSPALFALPTVKLFSGGVVVLIAFGGQGRLWRSIVVFFAVSAAFGGAVYAALSLGFEPFGGGIFVPVSMKVLALSFAICYGALSLVFRRMGVRAERCIVNVEVELGGRRASFKALHDTGNELCEPVSGQRVVIAEESALGGLLPGEISGGAAEMLLAAAKEPALTGRGRLIPFSSLGGEGLLFCFRPDKLLIDGNEEARLVAVSPGRLCGDGDYQGIV